MKEPHAIILFDGVCNFCNAMVQFILERDKRAYFQFGWLQSESAQRLLKEHGVENLGMETVVLIEDGQVYTKSDAGLRVFGHLGFPWNLYRMFRIYPRFLRDGVYNLIARKRYAWFGKRDACLSPDPAYADRFID